MWRGNKQTKLNQQSASNTVQEEHTEGLEMMDRNNEDGE